MVYRGWAFELLWRVTYLSTAEHALKESTEILEKLSLSDPKWPNVWFYLADTNITLGNVRWRLRHFGQEGDLHFRKTTGPPIFLKMHNTL